MLIRANFSASLSDMTESLRLAGSDQPADLLRYGLELPAAGTLLDHLHRLRPAPEIPLTSPFKVAK